MNVQLVNVISDITGDDDSDPGAAYIELQKCTAIQNDEASIRLDRTKASSLSPNSKSFFQTGEFKFGLHLSLSYTIYIIAWPVTIFICHQAMNVTFKSWKFLVKVTRKLEVIHDGFVETFPRDK